MHQAIANLVAANTAARKRLGSREQRVVFRTMTVVIHPVDPRAWNSLSRPVDPLGHSCKPRAINSRLRLAIEPLIFSTLKDDDLHIQTGESYCFEDTAGFWVA
jgi:hypothetical protein